jgi:hypothetical protein
MSPVTEIAPGVTLDESKAGGPVRTARPKKVYLSSARAGVMIRPVQRLIPMSDGTHAAPPPSARGTKIQFKPVGGVKPAVWANARFYYDLASPTPGDEKAEKWYDDVVKAIEGEWAEDANGTRYCTKEPSFLWKQGIIWTDELFRERQFDDEKDSADKRRIIAHIAQLRGCKVQELEREVTKAKTLYIELCNQEQELLEKQKNK